MHILTTKTNIIKDLFEKWSGEKMDEIILLPPSGSDREYYRVRGYSHTAIAAYNSDKKENLAFVTLTKHFFSKELPVPELYAEDLENNVYLMQDLGDTTLFSYISKARTSEEFPESLIAAYKKSLSMLARFQILGNEGLDYSICYPRKAFDQQSMLWDLSYFKYYFLKLARIPFDEQDLETDFNEFVGFLLKARTDFFLYRDFQTRNIMLVNGNPYFIDYQGGRQGALQYDLASILYQAKAAIPQNIREQLIIHYLDAVEELIPVNKDEFMSHFYGYVLIRMLQAMGAYGFRGFYERKEHFLSSIPFILNNINWILNNVQLPVEIPALRRVLMQLVESTELKKIGMKDTRGNNLRVTINSFSFKNKLPNDESGNGGGFIFDCRAIHNPGKYEEYKSLTGKDEKVKAFFAKERDVFMFLNNAYELIDQSVERYIERGFTNLSVSFGCTGGQHRSVFCADMMAKHLKEKFNIRITVNHIEQSALSVENY